MNRAFSRLRSFQRTFFLSTIMMVFLAPSQVVSGKSKKLSKAQRAAEARQAEEIRQKGLEAAKHAEEVTMAFAESLSLTENDYLSRASAYLQKLAESVTVGSNNGLQVVSEVNQWVMTTSLDSIKAVFFPHANLAIQRDDFKRVVKQASCIFVAESDFGNLNKNDPNYDNCDQTNVGQIRRAAYLEVRRWGLGGKFGDVDIKSVLGADADWTVLHPYEFPLCCNALNPDESRSQTKCEIKNDPEDCIDRKKRDYLEKHDLMIQIPKEAQSDSGTFDQLKSLLHRAIRRLSKNPNDAQADNIREDTHLEPVICKDTSKKKYLRVPAVPNHSIFTTVAYLRTQSFHSHISDRKFAEAWAPDKYNGSSKVQKKIYGMKVNACLLAMEKKNERLGKTTAELINEFVDNYIDSQDPNRSQNPTYPKSKMQLTPDNPNWELPANLDKALKERVRRLPKDPETQQDSEKDQSGNE